MKPNFTYQQLSKCLILGVTILFAGCDTSLNPISEGESIYSYYGILEIDQPVNFVRINDIKTPSNSLQELDLNVNVILKDLNTSDTFLLRDSLFTYDKEFITHNFYLKEPIKFDTDYVLVLENEEGLRDSVFTSTPKKASISVRNDNRKCNVPFFIDLSPVDDANNEIIEFEVEFLLNGKVFGASTARSITIENQTITYEFTPNQIIKATFGDGETVDCTQLGSNDLVFKYTHIGSFDYEQQRLISDDLGVPDIGERVLLGLYSDEFVVEIDTVPPPPFPSEFQY